MSGRRLGKDGERLAARYLEGLGYRVLHRNWRGRRGELDLVCEHQDTLVFVEVKSRSSRRYGSPEESVAGRKLRRLVALAEEYLAREVGGEVPCRFDVVAVESRPEGGYDVRHLSGVSVD